LDFPPYETFVVKIETYVEKEQPISIILLFERTFFNHQKEIITMKTKLFFTIMLSVSVILGSAQIIHVPADQATIQEGINAASTGDTVLVAEGTYYENINFWGKAITVASNFIVDGDTSHISNTIIDGSQPEDPDYGSVVTFDSQEDTTSILCGFTITGGTGTHFIDGPIEARAGGGIFFNRSGAKLTANYIIENEINYSNLSLGGGIVAGGFIDPQPWLVLRNNKINYNSSISTESQANGGGVEIYCNLIMDGNEISFNEAIGTTYSLGGGASIYGSFGHIEVKIINNNISNNKSISISEITEYSEGGGLAILRDVEGLIAYNDINSNSVESSQIGISLGGGVFIGLSSPDLRFENNFIMQNYSTSLSCLGGGICVWHGGGIYLNNVIGNNKGTFGGGAYLGKNNSDSLSLLINNTIINNESEYGGGLYLLEADAVVMNSILWGDSAANGPEIYQLESNLVVRYSDVEGDWEGYGNMDIDPAFAADGYHLGWSSLLVNEGRSSVLINGEWYDAPEYDIDGDERPYSWTDPDIGADEALWPYTSVDKPILKETLDLSIYPNPIVNSATIEYKLKNPSTVQIIIYNHLGEQVELIVNEKMPEGKHSIVWNAKGLSSGIYYCQLKTQNEIQTIKTIKL